MGLRHSLPGKADADAGEGQPSCPDKILHGIKDRGEAVPGKGGDHAGARQSGGTGNQMAAAEHGLSPVDAWLASGAGGGKRAAGSRPASPDAPQRVAGRFREIRLP